MIQSKIGYFSNINNKSSMIHFYLYIILSILFFILLYMIFKRYDNRKEHFKPFNWFEKNIWDKIEDFFEDSYDYIEEKIKNMTSNRNNNMKKTTKKNKQQKKINDFF